MRSVFLVFVFFLSGTLVFTAAQDIQYSKNNIDFETKRPPIIAGVFRDTLHIIKKNTKGFDLYLYNRYMGFIGKKSLSDNSKEVYNNIRVIRFKFFYYALLTNGKPEETRVMAINASGNNKDHTEKVKDHLKGIFPEYSSIAKFQTIQNQLILSIAYYDSSKQKIHLLAYYLDSLLQKQNERAVSLDYDPEKEIIHSVQFADTATAYFMKSFKNFTENAGEVNVFKFDFLTGIGSKRIISSSGNFFMNPLLDFNIADSSLLFFSEIRPGLSEKPSNSVKYYCLLMNKDLEEISTSRFIESNKKSSQKDVLFIDKVHFIAFNHLDNLNRDNFSRPFIPAVLPIQGYSTARDIAPTTYRTNQNRFSSNRPSFSQIQLLEPAYKRTDVNLKIIWSDYRSGTITDTLFKFKRGKFKPAYLNSFVSDNKSGLLIFFATGYPKGGGISYVSAENGRFKEEEHLMVNPQYEYFVLNTFKISDKEFIIPYAYKGKFGFLKLNY